MLRIVSISSITLGNDRGRADEIRTKYIHKGIIEKGIDLEVYSYITDISRTNSKKIEGEYLFDEHIGRNSTILTMFLKAVKFSRFLFGLDKSKVLLVDKLPIYLILPLILFKIFKKNFIVTQFNEFFVLHSKYNTFKALKYKLNFQFLKVLLKFTNLLIVISEDHGKYFSRFFASDTQYVVISILLDFNLKIIPCEMEDKNTEFKICYAGSISRSNGVELLIQSFAQVKTGVLTIFGPVQQDYKLYLIELIKELKLEKLVFIEDAKEYLDTMSFLKGQDLLVIPKLKDERSVGYIPSKLGDFLLSETATLVTDVGQMSHYIQDGHNGYLVKPDSIIELSNKLQECFNQRDLNRIVGVEGKKITVDFHYHSQVNKLIKEIIDKQQYV